MIPSGCLLLLAAFPDWEDVAHRRREGPAAGVPFFSYAALESELFVILSVSPPLE
jgi:hypothetical protein